jgi:hypothetical protein
MSTLSASSTSANQNGRCRGWSAAAGAPPLGRLAGHEPVLEEVEAELLRRAVGDVAGVGLAAGVEIHLRLDDAHRQAQRLVDRLHPLGVAAGEVVVDRGQVGAAAGQRVEHEGQRGHERLAFAGLHLQDRSVHERRPGEQLHVVVPHPEPPAARLAGGGEGIDEQFVERLARLGPVGERAAETAEFGVGDRLHRGREFVDPLGGPPRRGRDGLASSGTESCQPLEHAVPRHGPAAAADPA